jgi:glutaredoxin 2
LKGFNFITAEYYSFTKGNEKIFGSFQASLENPDEYIVRKFRYLGKVAALNVNGSSIHQIYGMEELAEMSPETIIRV